MIGKKLSSEAYIRIDSELDSKELVFIKEKIEYLREIVKVNKDVLVNLEKSLSRKRENYKRIEDLKFKSVVEKDREYYDLVSSENLYLSTQKEIQNLKVQITDLKLREAQLQRSISDKYVNNSGFVLYEISVKVGQVVNLSTPLAKVADTSRAKLTIYLDEPDVADATSRVIYIDGKKHHIRYLEHLKLLMERISQSIWHKLLLKLQDYSQNFLLSS